MSAIQELKPLYMYKANDDSSKVMIVLGAETILQGTLEEARQELLQLKGVTKVEFLQYGGQPPKLEVKLAWAYEDRHNRLLQQLKGHVNPRFGRAGTALVEIVRRASDHVHIGTVVHVKMTQWMGNIDIPYLLEQLEKHTDVAEGAAQLDHDTIILSLTFPRLNRLEIQLEKLSEILGLYFTSWSKKDDPRYAVMRRLDFKE